MRLKCLAGAYAGQELDYSTVTGLAALRSGMAERLDQPAVTPTTKTVTAAPAAPQKTRSGRGLATAGKR